MLNINFSPNARGNSVQWGPVVPDRCYLPQLSLEKEDNSRQLCLPVAPLGRTSFTRFYANHRYTLPLLVASKTLGGVAILLARRERSRVASIGSLYPIKLQLANKQRV